MVSLNVFKMKKTNLPLMDFHSQQLNNENHIYSFVDRVHNLMQFPMKNQFDFRVKLKPIVSIVMVYNFCKH